MKLGIHFMNFTHPEGAAPLRTAIGDTAVVADQAGIDLFTAMDHWFQMEHFQTAHEPMLEGYSVLSFVAAKTERLRLSLLVTGVTYRHPGLLAKTVTTLDVLSGGRALLGIGAAWYEREHRALGVPYPPVAERFERLEETIQICEQMWSDNDGPYDGKYYQLAETICSPRPLQSPRPPILIGGSGEKKTLRLVARYADACNLFSTSVAEVQHKLDVLRGHCDAEGRDYDAIEKTIIGRLDPEDPAAFLREMEQYAAIGIDLVEVAPTQPDPAGYVTMLGEKIVKPLAEIG
ncbi:MAG TPA: LLM class F420-dependent oxidoreductase [Trebonia sp.]|jgi:F420-dependent oxidoreductase-like protein